MMDYFKHFSKSVVMLLLIAVVVAAILLRDKNREKTDADGKPLPNEQAEAAMLKMRSLGLLPEYNVICFPHTRHTCRSGSCTAEDPGADFILVNYNGSSTISHCGEGGCNTIKMGAGGAGRFTDAEGGYVLNIASTYDAAEGTSPFIEFTSKYWGDGLIRQGYCYGDYEE